MDPIYEAYIEVNEAKVTKPEDWAVDADLKKNTVNKNKVDPSHLKDGEHLSTLPKDYSGRVDAIKRKVNKYGYKILRVGNYKDQGEIHYFVVYSLNGNK